MLGGDGGDTAAGVGLQGEGPCPGFWLCHVRLSGVSPGLLDAESHLGWLCVMPPPLTATSWVGSGPSHAC